MVGSQPYDTYVSQMQFLQLGLGLGEVQVHRSALGVKKNQELGNGKQMSIICYMDMDDLMASLALDLCLSWVALLLLLCLMLFHCSKITQKSTLLRPISMLI